jgi:hypothetical protein
MPADLYWKNKLDGSDVRAYFIVHQTLLKEKRRGGK